MAGLEKALPDPSSAVQLWYEPQGGELSIISLLLTFAPLHAVPDLPTTTLELVGRIASSEK